MCCMRYKAESRLSYIECGLCCRRHHIHRTRVGVMTYHSKVKVSENRGKLALGLRKQNMRSMSEDEPFLVRCTTDFLLCLYFVCNLFYCSVYDGISYNDKTTSLTSSQPSVCSKTGVLYNKQCVCFPIIPPASDDVVIHKNPQAVT